MWARRHRKHWPVGHTDPAAAAAAAAALAAALMSEMATLISEVLAALALEDALLAEALASPAEAAAVAAPLSMSVSVMLETVGSPSPSKPRSLDARSAFFGMIGSPAGSVGARRRHRPNSASNCCENAA